LRSAFSELLINYKKNAHFGKLRTGLLLAVLFEDQTFLKDLEARGLLLPSHSTESQKLMNMIEDISNELESCNIAELRTFHNRLKTYRNFVILNKSVEKELRSLDKILRKRSISLLKSALGTVEMKFLCKFFNLSVDSLPKEVRVILETSNTPEELASIISLLIGRGNELLPIRPIELQVPIYEGIRSEELKQAICGASILQSLHELAEDISFFGYEIEAQRVNKKVIFKVLPPDKDFEYFLRLGYIREDMNRQRSDILFRERSNFPTISIDTVTSSLIADHPDFFMQWKDYPYPRLITKFPLAEQFWKPFVQEPLLYEEGRYFQTLRNEYLVTQDEFEEKYLIPNVLSIKAFFDIARTFFVFSMFNIHALKVFHEKKRKFSYNSLVKAMEEKDLIEMLALSGRTTAEIKGFIELICLETKQKAYYDLQYQPLIKNENVYLMLPTIFISANIYRNIQVSNKIRVLGQAEKFVQLCKSIFESKFKRVVINKRVALGNKSTDIDIAVCEGKKLYLFECKYSVHPCDPHELRDIWEDILKGVQQLSLAKNVLDNPTERQSYLSGWFPGIRMDETKELEINTCILTPFRLFGGLTIQNIVIRDIYSLDLVLGENEIAVGIGELEGKYKRIRYSLVGMNGFSQEDFDDYLSSHSKYFRCFQQDMAPLSRIWDLVDGEVSIVRETFVYAFDFDSWPEQMEALGFYRLPDEDVEIKAPLTKEEFKDLLGKAKNDIPAKMIKEI